MPKKEKSDTGLKVTVKPFGPTSEELRTIGERVLRLESVRRCIGRSKTRLLYVEALDDDGDKERKPLPPNRFRATLYGDTNHRAILVDGNLRDARHVDITESALSPHSSDVEFASAVKVLRGDPAFAAALDARQLETYQPIPSLALNELPDGRIERRIAVGLLPEESMRSMRS
ncbi:MAG: hypothetical protein NTAFB01_43310 [Nitrospira sp.]